MAEFKHISGLSQLVRAMEELPKNVQRNALRKAASSGAAIVRTTVRNMAPVQTGKLKRSIAMKRARTPDSQIATYEVHVRQAYNAWNRVGNKKVEAYGKFDAYYARWIEYGTSQMSPQPFMRPAWQLSKDAAADKIVEVLRAKIAELAK